MIKNTLLVSLATVASSAIAFSAPVQGPAKYEVFPKNLARQHLGSNLFQFNSTAGTYTPTEAAAAWLDDDISTGWPAAAGHQYYLLALPQADLVTNFCLSARQSEGTITLYAGSELAAPGAKSWNLLAKDIPFASINEHKMDKPFSRVAKYVLIETNIADPGPIYSLYLYSEHPAVSYNLEARDQAINTRAIFGPYTNDATAINIAGLYAHSMVSESTAGGDPTDWQKAIDDNPESAMTLGGGSEKAEATIQYQKSQTISRIAILTEAGTRGKLDFFLTNAPTTVGKPSAVTIAALAGTATPAPTAPATTPVPPAPTAVPDAAPASAAPIVPKAADPASAPTGEATEAAPTASLVLDGTNSRTSLDLAATQATTMRVRWTPANGTDAVKIRELNVFGGPTLATDAIRENPAAIAEHRDRSKDGKDAKDAKDAIAEGPAEKPEAIASKEGFLPGGLGFPPNLGVGVRPPTSTRTTVVSPPSPPPLSP